MKLPLDPRLPQAGGPDSQRTMYARLYEMFRSHAAAVNAVDAAGSQNSTDIAANAATLAGHTTDISANTTAIATNTSAIATKAAQSDFLELKNNSQWYGKPIGEPFPLVAGAPLPPTDNPNFRFIVLTAGQTGAGQYNQGVLTGETVTGSAPLVTATATINLAGSPLDGTVAHLINTEGRFIGAGATEAFENDSIQNIVGEFAFSTVSGGYGVVGASGTVSGAFKRGAATTNTLAGYSGSGNNLAIDTSLVVRASDHTQPRAHRVPHYMRIL